MPFLSRGDMGGVGGGGGVYRGKYDAKRVVHNTVRTARRQGRRSMNEHSLDKTYQHPHDENINARSRRKLVKHMVARAKTDDKANMVSTNGVKAAQRARVKNSFRRQGQSKRMQQLGKESRRQKKIAKRFGRPYKLTDHRDANTLARAHDTGEVVNKSKMVRDIVKKRLREATTFRPGPHSRN